MTEHDKDTSTQPKWTTNNPIIPLQFQFYFANPNKTVKMRPTLLSILSLALGLVSVHAIAPSPAPVSISGWAKGQDLITAVCERSIHKELCLSSLAADPNTKTADLSGLTLISIRLATSSGTNTSGYIQDMLRKEDLDPEVEQCLNDCSENYLDAVDQLDDSLAALTVRNYADLEKWIGAAGDDADWCEGCFKDNAPQKAILSERNKMFKHLCDNAMTVAKCLEADKQWRLIDIFNVFTIFK